MTNERKLEIVKNSCTGVLKEIKLAREQDRHVRTDFIESILASAISVVNDDLENEG